MRRMYDADNPYDIPRDAEMVAGYVDGSRTTWTNRMWEQFPDAVKVRISAVGATHKADVFDVEPGCIWPPVNVIPLVLRAREEGINPAVYCNEMNHWPGIRRMFRERGIAEPLYWVANYDGVEEVPPGAIAKQFMHPPQIGKHYDLSAVADYWPGVDTERENEMGYSSQQIHLPAGDGSEYLERDISLPHMGGATRVTARYVTLFAPGMPFVSDGERAVANIRFAHWVDGSGERVGYYFPGGDDVTLEHHDVTSGQYAPNDAVKLVLQYDSPVGLNAVVEVLTA